MVHTTDSQARRRFLRDNFGMAFAFGTSGIFPDAPFAGSPSSAAGSRLNSGAGAVSVMEFGARGDGVSVENVAFQRAIDHCIANNIVLLVPPARYIFNAPLLVSFGGNSRGLTILGATGNNILGQRGSILDFVRMSPSAAINVTGDARQGFVFLQGLSVIGSANGQSGLKTSNASYIHLERCVFSGFGGKGASAVSFFASDGGFSGLGKLENCMFQANDVGVLIVGDNNNVFTIDKCVFLDHIKTAVMVGAYNSLQQNRSVNILNCDFEGNARDIYTLASMHQLRIVGNYFENNSVEHRDARVEIGYTAPNAGSGAVAIDDNSFQNKLVADGQSMIKLEAVDKFSIRRNYSAFGNHPRRYFVAGTNCTGGEFDVADTAAGETPSYPILIGPLGPVSQSVFTFSATSDDRVKSQSIRIEAGQNREGTTEIHQAVYSRHGSVITYCLDISAAAFPASLTGRASIAGLNFANCASPVRIPVQASSANGEVRTLHGIILPDATRIDLFDERGSPLAIRELFQQKLRLCATFTYIAR